MSTKQCIRDNWYVLKRIVSRPLNTNIVHSIIFRLIKLAKIYYCYHGMKLCDSKSCEGRWGSRNKIKGGG